MAAYLIQEETLKAIGDGFRSAKGTTEQYTPEQMATMAAESGGGGGVETCTATIINGSDSDVDVVYVSKSGVEMPYVLPSKTMIIEPKRGSLFIVYGEGLRFKPSYDGDAEGYISFYDAEGLYYYVSYIGGNVMITLKSTP